MGRGTQAHYRLAMNLTDTRLADVEDAADLFQVQILLVVQRKHEALAFRQLCYRIREIFLKLRSEKLLVRCRRLRRRRRSMQLRFVQALIETE